MRRKPKLLKSKIKNVPSTNKGQEDYDKKVCKTLAQALYRNLEPKEYNQLIENLKSKEVN